MLTDSITMESCDTICITFVVLQNSGKLVQTLVLGSKSELYLKLKNVSHLDLNCSLLSV